MTSAPFFQYPTCDFVNIWFSFRIYNVFVYPSGRPNDVSQYYQGGVVAVATLLFFAPSHFLSID